MTKRMGDEEFEKLFERYYVQGKKHLPKYYYDRIAIAKNEAKRARHSEQNLKAQILELFEYLVANYPKEIFNDNANGACKTAVNIMEKQHKILALDDELNELFKKKTDILKLDKEKLIELVVRMKSICLQ